MADGLIWAEDRATRMSTGTDRETDVNWSYLGQAAVLVGVGVALAAGVAVGADATGVAPTGLALLGTAAAGGLGLLAFFGATTAEPNQSSDLAVNEMFERQSDDVTPLDRGFQVSALLLWVSLGLALGGVGGLVAVFG
jgi:hypothetical protein